MITYNPFPPRVIAGVALFYDVTRLCPYESQNHKNTPNLSQHQMIETH